MNGRAPVEHFTGQIGSEFWRLTVPPEFVAVMAAEIDWCRMGRRVMIDARAGTIDWTSPSHLHADMAVAAGKVVETAAHFLGMPVQDKRDAPWRRPRDPKNTGLEADASFYVGEHALQWYAALDKGEDAAEEFAAKTPPDLVVEIEVTHLDGDKPQRWAALGVREMWRAATDKAGKGPEITILGLQAQNKPPLIEESLVLPGLRARVLTEAFGVARRGKLDRLYDLLSADLVPAS